MRRVIQYWLSCLPAKWHVPVLLVLHKVLPLSVEAYSLGEGQASELQKAALDEHTYSRCGKDGFKGVNALL